MPDKVVQKRDSSVHHALVRDCRRYERFATILGRSLRETEAPSLSYGSCNGTAARTTTRIQMYVPVLLQCKRVPLLTSLLNALVQGP